MKRQECRFFEHLVQNSERIGKPTACIHAEMYMRVSFLNKTVFHHLGESLFCRNAYACRRKAFGFLFDLRAADAFRGHAKCPQRQIP